jgi:hypothetical protein
VRRRGDAPNNRAIGRQIGVPDNRRQAIGATGHSVTFAAWSRAEAAFAVPPDVSR